MNSRNLLLVAAFSLLMRPAFAAWVYGEWYDGQPVEEVLARVQTGGRKLFGPHNEHLISAHGPEGESYWLQVCHGRLSGLIHSKPMTSKQAKSLLDAAALTRGEPYTERDERFTKKLWRYPDHGVKIELGRNDGDAARPVSYLIQISRDVRWPCEAGDGRGLR